MSNGASKFQNVRSLVTGVWLPIVTPFVNGSVDFKSYERLLRYYLDENIDGVIPLGATGESATIDDDEAAAIVELTVDVVDGRIPIYVGVGSNSTAKVVKSLKRLEQYSFAGILSVCPYYNRPSEEGIYQHFARVAECTDRNLLIYNIPYRTGVNLSNDAVLALSEIPNIVGIKDSSASMVQSMDLLRRRPAAFSVMTGEDALFYTMLALGGNGGILAAAHFRPAIFLEIYERMAANDHRAARAAWTTVEATVPLFFKEPNPAPIKHWLWRKGLIQSPECRLPLTKVSTSLAKELDAVATDPARAQ
jgi:4-hydroxy-tetrahydrodipicolinate synthase